MLPVAEQVGNRVASTTAQYDPATFRPLTYYDATDRFRDGSDDARPTGDAVLNYPSRRFARLR
jgi:hypothetical protein